MATNSHSITDFGLINSEIFKNAHDLVGDLRQLRFPAPEIVRSPWVDVPGLGLRLRLIHVYELPPP